MTRVLAALAPAGLELPESLLGMLGAAYATPPRAYHSMRHIEEVARRFDEVAVAAGWQRPRETYLAVLFHDAVYVAGARTNEAESAALARATLAADPRFGDIDAGRVAELVMLTARHGRLEGGDVDGEAALFLDCDMAILGSAAAEFDAYDRAIAVEYAQLPAAQYRAGRRAFFERLLARPRIFLSEHFHARLDALARDNLRRALDFGRPVSRASG